MLKFFMNSKNVLYYKFLLTKVFYKPNLLKKNQTHL